MRRLPTANHGVAFLFVPVITLMLLAASGCAVHRVRADFTGFEKAYADTSNRELLLNLARLQNHDPTYFFKMGQITSSYRMVASVSSLGSYVSQSTVANKSSATGSGMPGLSYESDPLFQFIPVNDETNAQLLLKPIPPDTFYILYQQGWRIDQLLRVMVDRIEVTQSTKSGCKVTTYRNVPPALKISGGLAVPLDEKQLSSYASFLRISAVAYGLQKHGDLLLRGISTFVPLDAKAETAGPSTTSASTGDLSAASLPVAANPVQNPAEARTHKEGGISASDIEKAAEKNLSYESDSGGHILIGQRMVNPKFYLIPPAALKIAPSGYEPDIKQIEKDIGKDEHLQGLENAEVLAGFLAALHDGFSIEGDANTLDQAGDPCPIGNEHYNVHLFLRSLIGVMAAAAQEQKSFDELQISNTLVQPLEGNEPPHLFDKEIPDIELLPILRINWKSDTEITPAQQQPRLQPTPELTELNYRGTEYLIADPRDPSVPENEYWNRDVFRLIGALTAQVTVDISKYPIANILQLNTQ